MSDTTTNQTDAAVSALRERERQLDVEVQMLAARRDEVRELISLLESRRPRAPRKPRVVEAPAADASNGSAILHDPVDFAFAPAADAAAA